MKSMKKAVMLGATAACAMALSAQSLTCYDVVKRAENVPCVPTLAL